MLKENPDVTRKLRALWCLHATGGVDEATTQRTAGQPRAVPARLGDPARAGRTRRPAPPLATKLAELAKADPSPAVRLFLASGLQRLPVEQRWPIASALVAHAEDAADKDLPLMDWYGTAELASADPARASQLIPTAKVPLVRQYLARRAGHRRAAAAGGPGWRCLKVLADNRRRRRAERRPPRHGRRPSPAGATCRCPRRGRPCSRN